MAAYTIAAGMVGSHAKQLVANDVTTFTFTDNIAAAEIITDGTALIYYTVDGTTPTIGGANCYMLPAMTSISTRETKNSPSDTITMISVGTPTVWVQRV